MLKYFFVAYFYGGRRTKTALLVICALVLVAYSASCEGQGTRVASSKSAAVVT